MKFSTLLDMFVELLSKGNLTANYFAEKYGLSLRTVQRYLEILSTILPLQRRRGRNGGIYLSDTYKIPFGFLSVEEYNATIEALSVAYAQTLEERFLEVKRKLSNQGKREAQSMALASEMEQVLFEEGAFDAPRSTLEKLRLIGACIRSRTILEVEYIENGEKIIARIEPHLLLIKRQCWYVYAFCHGDRRFAYLSLGKMRSLVRTEKSFRRRSFERENVINLKGEEWISVRMEIAKESLDRATEWLGVDSIICKKGKYIADVVFFGEEDLPKTLLSFGTGIKVVSPKELKDRMLCEAKKMITMYQES